MKHGRFYIWISHKPSFSSPLIGGHISVSFDSLLSPISIGLVGMVSDRAQISLLLANLKQLINFYSLLKSSENHRFLYGFRGNKSSLIRLNSLNIKAKLETITQMTK